MLFWIGINLGDVIEDGDRIYKKLVLDFEYMGEHTVRNMV